MKFKVGEKKPVINDNAFIAHNATVIGDVELGDQSSVWFNAVLRGDSDRIVIGRRSNIQDAAVLHIDPGYPLLIGDNVTVGHKAVLHGCTVGDNSLIGINAVVLNGAKIGNYCLIGANALVPEGMEIPDGSLVLGSPAKIKKTLTDEQRAGLEKSAQTYVDKAQLFIESFNEVEE